MQGNSLKSVSAGGRVEATVLSEELAYNRTLQQFKIFILDRPLDSEYKVGGVTHTQHTHTHTHTRTHTHTHTRIIIVLYIDLWTMHFV